MTNPCHRLQNIIEEVKLFQKTKQTFVSLTENVLMWVIQQTLSKNKHLFRVWCSLSFEPRFRSPTNPFEKVPFSLDAKCSTVFTRRMLTMCPLLLWASSKFVCYSLLQILSMKAVNVDRTSEVVARKNQNNEPKETKMWCDVIHCSYKYII